MDYPLASLLLTFCGAAGLSILLGLGLRALLPRHPSWRRLGGSVVIAAFIIGTFLQPDIVVDAPLRSMLWLSLFILAIGFIDDRRPLAWTWQLLFQGLVAGLAFWYGVRLESLPLPWGETLWLDPASLFWPSLLFSTLWLIFLMNALNWVDGTDGLMGSVALVAFLVVAALSLKPEVNQPPVAILSMILAGATLGFLAFNFPPARLFAGTSGALFLGFVLGALSIFAGTKVATALLVLTLPVVDALFVVGERWASGASIFLGDQRHLHYKLRRLGWSDRRILVCYTLITALIAVLGLNTENLGKFLSIVVSFAGAALFIAWASRAAKRRTPSP